MQFISFKWITGDKSPVSVLLVFLFLIFVTGTLIFYIFLLSGSIIFDISVSEMLLPFGERQIDNIWEIRYLQVSQQLSFFLLPALLMILLYRKSGLNFRLIDGRVGIKEFFLVFILAIFTMNLTIWTGLLNSKIELPQVLSGVEEWIKEKEEEAAGITGLLLKNERNMDYLITIFVLAVIPAVCEELIFRGVFQQIVGMFFRSKHLPVWITAIIFSVIHLQFYGFLPRIILGLIFGYLFLWSGNILIPIAAHFLNNFLASTLHIVNGLFRYDKGSIEEQDVSFSAFPLLSVIVVAIILYIFWRDYKKKRIIGI